MKNKILINLYVPYLDENYDLFIPANESIKKVLDLIVKSVSDMSDNTLDLNVTYCLLEPETSQIYHVSYIVRDTNIVNGKKLILI